MLMLESCIMTIKRRVSFLFASFMMLTLTLLACGAEQTTPTASSLVATATKSNPTNQPDSSVVTFAPTQILPTILPTKPALPQDWQYRWLRGIPCRPPCWEGVTPGKTTPSEAVEILNRSPLVVNAKMETNSLFPENGTIVWYWVGNEKGDSGYDGEIYYSAKNLAVPVYQIRPRLRVKFKLQDVIQAYGEPEYVIASDNPNPDIGSGRTYSIKFIFLSQGFTLDYGVISKDESGKPAINPGMLVSEPDYFASGIEGYNRAYRGLQPQPDLFVSWQGFKDFDFYCRTLIGSDVKDCTYGLKPAPGP